MKIGIVLLCRYDSKRLPGKILRTVDGRTVLGHILDRLRNNISEIPVVVATSKDLSDEPIVRACYREGVECFRGSLNDVSNRFIEAAQHKEWDYVVRINGDNIFADTDSIRSMAAIAETGVFDFVTNVPGRHFPAGMSVEIVKTQLFLEKLPEMNTEQYREHVTLWLYDNLDKINHYIFPNRICPEAEGLNFALDTNDDLLKVNEVLKRAGSNPAGLRLNEIVKLNIRPLINNFWKGSVGPLLIAEIGGNHEGNFNHAMAMTQSAIEAGADCVKFQIYTGDSLVSSVESPQRHNHFKKFELTKDQHRALAETCRNAGVIYLASVWDEEAFDWVDEYLDFYKVGSGDMTAWPLLAKLVKRGKPILLSTGLSTLDEVLQTVKYIQSLDSRYSRPEYLCLLQCTSMYPIPDKDAHLAVMNRFKSATGLAVGYSDHTEGSAALRVATAMGAEVLEFHFTDSREGKTFRDHKVSLTGAELQQLKKDIEQITELKGGHVKEPQQSELDAAHEVSFRRAVYLKRDIEAGEVIDKDDLTILRPMHGVDAREIDQVIGAVAKRPIRMLTALKPEDDF